MSKTKEAVSAYHNDTLVESQDGAQGRITGSMGPIAGLSHPFVYCVAWNDEPDHPQWIVGSLIRPVLLN